MAKFDSGRFSGTKGSLDDGFRRVEGYTTKLNRTRQAKHIPSCKGYIPGRSIFKGSLDDAQALIEQYGGTGQRVGKSGYRERVDFGVTIGTYVSQDGSVRVPTTRGIIYYSKSGAHIAPSRPRGME